MGIGKKHVHSTFANLALAKQQAVLRAAIAEFARQGYGRASINVIVREAGISKGSLYQYFPNKEALFHFVFARFNAKVKGVVKALGVQDDFFLLIRQVLEAGLAFIDSYPEYFQIYLRVLFEQDVPRRQELINQVRLFSAEYFGPVCAAAQVKGVIRSDISLEMVIFILDAAIDRFLQAYAQPYLAGGLGLVTEKSGEIDRHISDLIKVLQEGLKG